MTSTITRRDFVKAAGGGIAAIVIGSQFDWILHDPAFMSAQARSISLEINDAMKDMVTHNSINVAQCYHWIYKCTNPVLPPTCPGPNIYATVGDPAIPITIVNKLDEPHAFFIPGFGPGDAPLINSGPIAPGATFTGSINLVGAKAGAYLYYDNLNEPVNRVMGLHGALIMQPAARAAVTIPKLTPYTNPTPNVQALFNSFGADTAFPGLAWEQGDPNPDTFAQPFRNYVWIDHQPSPNLFAKVGNFPAGQIYPAQQFMTEFLRDPFSPTNANNHPQYFTITGQSGHFAHNSTVLCPHLRVGEPIVIHILNAGLWTHSMHLHANHFFVTCVNGVVQQNPIWVDLFTIRPMDRVDYIFPYMRTPDVPNERGIGRPDRPLVSIPNPDIPGSVPHPIWPPLEEIQFCIPAFSVAPLPPNIINPTGVASRTARDAAGATIDLGVQLSPICYPMHDHSEPSQTAQGGNYNCGIITGINFIGDRNVVAQTGFTATPGIIVVNGVATFPNHPTPDMCPLITGTNDPAPQPLPMD